MQFGYSSCPYCGNPSPFLYIHGHYQCHRCGQNVLPCCSGEQEINEPSGDENTNEQVEIPLV